MYTEYIAVTKKKHSKQWVKSKATRRTDRCNRMETEKNDCGTYQINYTKIRMQEASSAKNEKRAW